MAYEVLWILENFREGLDSKMHSNVALTKCLYMAFKPIFSSGPQKLKTKFIYQDKSAVDKSNTGRRKTLEFRKFLHTGDLKGT